MMHLEPPPPGPQRRRAPKGVWSGAFFFQMLALSLMTCMLWPNFGALLIEKTELGSEFCWMGEGVWLTSHYWGGDSLCPSSSSRFPSMDAVQLYCEHPEQSPFSLGAAKEMCHIVKRGRVLHVAGMAFAAVAVFFALHLQYRAKQALESKLLQAKLSLAALLLSLGCFTWFLIETVNSPLFFDSHYSQLGKGNIVPYRGLGCVFQSPFVNMDLFHSKPLKCLYPGPGVAFMLAIVAFQCMGVVALGVIAWQPGALLPNKSHTTYSLHGAFMHKLSSFHRWEQLFVGFFVPLIAVGNGALLLSWFYHGMQFAVKVHVTVAGQEFIDTRLQVFCFDPVTILRTLWLGGTYLISICTFVFVDFFPFFKILLWVLLWFVPIDQTVRGRVFNWIEYLGRWSLANLFCLCVIAIGFLFDETMELLVGVVRVRVQVVIGKGAGVDWFIVAMIWTVALGSLFLDIHLWAREWEMERHAVQAKLSESTHSLDGGHEGADDRRRSLIGRALSRAAHQFTRSVGDKQRLSRQTLFPTNGVRWVGGLRTSTLGHVVSTAAMLVLLAATVASLFLPVIAYKRSGVVPDALIPERDTEHTVWDLIQRTLLLGGPQAPLWTFACVIALFAGVFPLLHAVALLVLWQAKLAVKRQKQLFRAVEFLDAWNSLDVLFLAVCLTRAGSGTIGKSVVAVTVPGMTDVARALFGPGAQVDMLDSELRPGFWVMLFALVLDKSLAYCLMQLCATSLALRQKKMAQEEEEEGSHDEEEEEEVQSLFSDGDEPTPESLDALMLYSPADRYVGASSTSARDIVYAGMPKPLWHLLVACHVLVENGK